MSICLASSRACDNSCDACIFNCSAMSPYSAPFNVELKTTYWIMALYSLARSSFNPRMISSLLEVGTPSASAGSEFVLFDTTLRPSPCDLNFFKLILNLLFPMQGDQDLIRQDIITA